ncbi:hypothetical protein KUTeg_012684 [Tegillarca granosa]|uniref:Uncharacterized protein n=1 Tax=Tegillarca granosa TaxID=220873 RepID=A0ABQ9F089_TEGGR|nr:hypothetical protein KUTeg_012684 [Tegillarca granosa]
MKPNITITDHLLEKAKHLILPPPPIPLRTISTVQGQLSKIESTRTVKVSGHKHNYHNSQPRG